MTCLIAMYWPPPCFNTDGGYPVSYYRLRQSAHPGRHDAAGAAGCTYFTITSITSM